MPHLFSPIKIKDIEFRNRIVVSPMCQYSSVDGFADNWHLVHLGSRAVGGAALVITEAIAVSPEGRISYGDLGIYSDDHIPKLREITDFIHQHGAIAGAQLAHAGRKASKELPWMGGKQIMADHPNGWEPVAPSAIPFDTTEPNPIELDKAGIDKVKADFKAATVRAIEAGFKVIEIHAGHGYILHQFYSPLSNRRIDEYGGSFENRIRLLLEVVAEVQTVWPAGNPLFVRISATDWADEAGGWNVDDSIALAKVLKDNGVDLVDTSTGGNVLAKIPLKPGYQVEFAEAVGSTGVATGAVGLITEAKQADEIIQTGKADMVFMARQLLRDPYFPLRAAHELGHEVTWPVQYERAKFRG